MMILAFYGAGGLGMECSSLAEHINEIEHRWEQFVFVNDNVSKDCETLLDYPVMTFERALQTYGKENMEFMVAIGEVAVKKAIYEKLKDCGCKLTNLINPVSSIHRSTQLGEGVMVGRNAAIGPKVVLGNNVLVRGNTVLGHDCVLEDNVEVCAFSVVGGNTVVGNNTFVGLHACLREGIKIGENVIIGMGSFLSGIIGFNLAHFKYLDENKIIHKENATEYYIENRV